MLYRRHPPRPELADVVEHYWTIEAPAPPEPIRAVLVPHGRATAQLCLGTAGTRTAPGGRPARNADVLLPATCGPHMLEQDGPSHYVGVQFTPWGVRDLWPHAPDAPSRLVDVADALPDRVALATDPVVALDRWLLQQTPTPRRDSELVHAAIRHIDADPTAVEVRHLPAHLGTSTSTVFREFTTRIGLPPGRYIAIMRYRAFTDALLAAGDGSSGALLAALAGYCDRSHAHRTFVRHTGMTPGEFRDAYDGIARLMTDTSKPGPPAGA